MYVDTMDHDSYFRKIKQYYRQCETYIVFDEISACNIFNSLSFNILYLVTIHFYVHLYIHGYFLSQFIIQMT